MHCVVYNFVLWFIHCLFVSSNCRNLSYSFKYFKYYETEKEILEPKNRKNGGETDNKRRRNGERRGGAEREERRGSGGKQVLTEISGLNSQGLKSRYYPAYQSLPQISGMSILNITELKH